MSVYILLPPLSHSSTPVSADTPVQLRNGSASWHSLPLRQAVQTHRKAVVLLHAVDAPMLCQALPPLPKAKRTTALKVMLEDRILGDINSMALAIEPLGAHRYAVSYCDRSLLGAIQAVFTELGVNPAISTLSAHLPQGTIQNDQAWTLWSNAQAAGASPAPTGNADVTSQTQAKPLHIQANPLRFVQSADHHQRWQHWRWVVYSLFVCLAVGLIGQWVYWRSLVNAQAAVQQRINAAFQKALPKTPQSKNPVAQIQAAIHNPNTSSALGTAITKVPSELPSAAVRGFDWKSGTLQLTISQKAWPLDEATKSSMTQRLISDKITLIWVE